MGKTFVAASTGLTPVGIGNEGKPEREDSNALSQPGCAGSKMRQASERKMVPMAGPLVSSLSFTAQTVETPNTTVKPGKPNELVAGVALAAIEFQLKPPVLWERGYGGGGGGGAGVRAFLFQVWNQRFHFMTKTFNLVDSSLKLENIKKRLHLLHFTDEPSGGSGSNSEPVKKEEN